MPAPLHAIHAWWDPPADGPTNMALDEALATEAALQEAVLVRISTWSRPALSLGAFQALEDARASTAFAGLGIVRRSSGGGAIVHGSDITLCVAVPRGHRCGGTPQVLYDVAHGALVEELRFRGVEASMSAGRPVWASAPGIPAAPDSSPIEGAVTRLEKEPFLCFDRRATGDVVIPDPRWQDGRDCKILGSAQRRLRGAILQHGTLLLAANRGVPVEVRHPGLDDLVGPEGSWQLPRAVDVVRGWLRRLAAGLGSPLVEAEGCFEPGPESGFESAVARFQLDSWTARR